MGKHWICKKASTTRNWVSVCKASLTWDVLTELPYYQGEPQQDLQNPIRFQKKQKKEHIREQTVIGIAGQDFTENH